jgi:hypothetical protein
MKRVSVGLLLCAVSVALAVAHQPGVDETSVDLGKGKVTIRYGTPKLAGRNLDEMIKPNMPWRMGMNDPTTLETTVALDFNGKKLQPGKYTLFARQDESKNWALLISSGDKAMLDPSSVIVEAPLHFMKDNQSQDLLKITLDKAQSGASLIVAWGTYRLHGTMKAA